MTDQEINLKALELAGKHFQTTPDNIVKIAEIYAHFIITGKIRTDHLRTSAIFEHAARKEADLKAQVQKSETELGSVLSGTFVQE